MEHEVRKVLSIGDLHQMPHWKIYIGNSAKGPIYCSSDVISQPDTSITWETSKVVLESYLNLLPVGMYTIHYKTKADEKLDKYCLTFQITEGTTPGVGGVNQLQLQQQMNPQWMFGILQNQFTAEIGRVTSEITAKFERQAMMEEHKRKMEDLERKYKKEKTTSFDYKELPGIIRESANTFFEIRAMKNGTGAQPQIAISGHSESKIPADAGKTINREEEIEKLDEKFIALQEQTMTDLAKMFGGYQNAIVELHCLKEFLKAKTAMYNMVIVPDLKPYKDAINDRLGITAG